MLDSLGWILSEASNQLESDPNVKTIDWLARSLSTIYDAAAASGKLDEFQIVCQSHPLSAVFLQDPYARRAFEKPRGYAGDAVMLDYIYRPSGVQLSGSAKAISDATTGLPNAESILWRRDYLARLIKNKMDASQRPKVLSVASGHMRELDTLRTLTPKTTVDFVALDQDKQSIAEATSTYNEYSIEGKAATFASLMRGRLNDSKFDLIYSAGLFDYLEDKTAVALIKAMCEHLKPSGTVTVGNFTRDSHGRGFMAGFMDWRLIYRNENDLHRLVSLACPDAKHCIFRDAPGNVAYVEIFAPEA